MKDAVAQRGCKEESIMRERERGDKETEGQSGGRERERNGN